MISRCGLSSVLLTVALSFSSASAQTPPAQQKLDGIGTYDLTFENHGQTQPAVVRVTKTDEGRLTGTLEVHGQTVHLTSVVLEARKLTLMADMHGDGNSLTLTLNFKTNDKIEGSYVSPGMGNGTLSGVRRKA
ncbi:MAG: hypothetical protein ACRENP_26670 [Longimicrobiales bacterium]